MFLNTLENLNAKLEVNILNDHILEFSLTATESQLGTAMKRMLLVAKAVPTEQEAGSQEHPGKVLHACSISGTNSVDFKAALADLVCLKMHIGCKLFAVIALGYTV